MENKPLKKRCFPYLLILSMAVVFVLPQIMSHGMIIGSDGIFHFNRFYDTAMQIKTGNFHYFLTTFGFQQTGRIINPFYGPLMAYFQGVLVLVSGSWFRYQILANFILYVTSGIAMFTLLKKNLLSAKVSLFTALLFMTTYSIHYWTIGQCFSSWGAAFLPLALIPLRSMILEGKILILPIGFSVALMLQIHLFSCLQLVMIYTIFFAYSWSKSSHKLQMLGAVLLAILLFALLTANVWINLLHLYQTNKILAPFINQKMHLATINRNSWYWLVNPLFLIPILISQFRFLLTERQKLSQLNKISSLTASLFLSLASSLIPWKFLMQQEIKIVQLVQFPFRFFIPFTVMILFSFALSLEEQEEKATPYLKYRQPIILISLMQVVLTSGYGLSQWLSNDIHSFESLHTHIESLSSQSIKIAFFQKDLALGLAYWQKSTPDYLPLYQETKENNYQLYEKLILQQHSKYKRISCKAGLRIEWQAEKKAIINLPIILYQNSQLTVNGEKIRHSQKELSPIGTPKIQQQSGKNHAILSYKAPDSFASSLLLTLVSWFSLLLYMVIKIVKKPRGCDKSSQPLN